MRELRQRFCWAPVATVSRRSRHDLSRVIVHRIEVSQEDPTFADTPADVIRFFATHPIGLSATGGSMPYPLLIDAAGTVTQTRPLLQVTPHARAYNETAIGVGCLGDFRREPPGAAQYEALVGVCAHLLATLGLPVDALHGHDGLAGSSADPDKQCPGEHLPLSALRQAVQRARGTTGWGDWVW